ncbi:MAG: hypothetical protein WD063_17775 [Pirellulales bacterium]
MARFVGGLVLLAAAILGTKASQHQAAGITGSSREEGQMPEVQQPQQWGDPAGGLVTALTAARREFPDGTPVDVRLWVKNVSGQQKRVEHCGFWPNHYLRVTDQDGREVPTTQKGAATRAAFKKPSRRKCFFIPLEPDKIDDAYESFDLREYFELPTGEIHVECESWLGGRPLLSNRLTMIVNGK